MDKLVSLGVKNVELTAINEMYCLTILLLRKEAEDSKVKKLVEKYKEYLPNYSYTLDKLIQKPSYNLAEWVFDYVICDMYSNYLWN
ncbi:MAG: hypothetical protein ACRCU6_07125 [Fusobacteriaceae bacterium]